MIIQTFQMLDSYTTPTRTEDIKMAKPVKAPFGYYGAKSSIAKRIIAELPPHHAWVEGFCGSAAITLAKPPVPIEIINDADDEIVNLFEQLRDRPEELCRAVALTPYSRAEYQKAHTKEKGLGPLERARRFLVATMMTVNSVNGPTHSGFSFTQSYTRGDKEARVNRWYNLPGRLEKVVERLRGVRIENRDVYEIVEMFHNRPATLMYLDPPYFVKRSCEYTIDSNNLEFHTKLLDVCQRVHCMILISGYENNLYDNLLTPDNGWTKKKIETHTRDTTGTNFPRTEVLWMNAQFVKAKKTNRVPIRLKAKEKKENKINPPRKR